MVVTLDLRVSTQILGLHSQTSNLRSILNQIIPGPIPGLVKADLPALGRLNSICKSCGNASHNMLQ